MLAGANSCRRLSPQETAPAHLKGVLKVKKKRPVLGGGPFGLSAD